MRQQSLCADRPGALPMNRPLKTARQTLVEAPCCALLLLFLALNGCRKSADEYLQRAHEAAYRKDPQRALREYRLALDAVDRLDTTGAQAVRARALRGAADIYYLELRDIPRAVEAYRELLQVCPEAPESIEGHICGRGLSRASSSLSRSAREHRGAYLPCRHPQEPLSRPARGNR